MTDFVTPGQGTLTTRPSTFEAHVSAATVAMVLHTRATDLPSALNLVKRVRELGYRMQEAGARG